ncbi:hypothetical protein F5Y10DRAFT_263485 [Nemania abortiva]|nr:hypothetical protein F5Y10DRAFT_263485 [Nemania abortiva]
MLFSNRYMDEDLLAVGGWADDEIPNLSSTTRPQQRESARHHVDTPTEPHRESRPHKAECARPDGQNHRSKPSRSEDESVKRQPQYVMKEVRVTEPIRRQHPACFVKVEGGQQGNKATAKPSTSLSKVVLKRASSYLAPDAHEVKLRNVYWSG